jgi:hypothetical protein
MSKSLSLTPNKKRRYGTPPPSLSGLITDWSERPETGYADIFSLAGTVEGVCGKVD